MAILFATSGDTGVDTSVLGWTIGGTLRAGYCRAGFSLTSNNSVTDPPGNRIRLLPFTPSGVIWVHALVNSSTINPLNDLQSIRVLSPDGVARVLLRGTATAGQQKASIRNAAGTITNVGAASSANVTSGFTTFIDIRIDYTGAAGGIQVWFNAVQVINYTGDLRTDAATQLNQVEFATLSQFTNALWGEFIVADEDTRGMALWEVPPVASGNTQGWTPNTVGNINENVMSDATTVTTATNNVLSEWAVTGATPPGGSWAVKALIEEARVSIGGTGPAHFDWVVRTASTDYLAGASVAPVVGVFGNFQTAWQVNPNTGSAWAVSDITAAGFNYGVKSLA